jgi:hypothetical protein
MKTLLLLWLLTNVTTYSQVSTKPVLETVLASNQRDTVCLQYLTVKEFKNKLALIETANLKEPYQAVNQFGYSGKYQLSRDYIQKYSRTTYENFLRSSWIQERTMNRLIAHYLNAIYQRGWDAYIGKCINGVTITLEGLLAGYHQHPAALKAFLTSNGKYDFEDGNYFPVSSFIKHYDYTRINRD